MELQAAPRKFARIEDRQGMGQGMAARGDVRGVNGAMLLSGRYVANEFSDTPSYVETSNPV